MTIPWMSREEFIKSVQPYDANSETVNVYRKRVFEAVDAFEGEEHGCYRVDIHGPHLVEPYGKPCPGSIEYGEKRWGDQRVDNVDHPAHYTQYKGLEVIDLAEQMNFNCGNVVKYVCRAGFKSPETHVEDLRKARWYLDKEIERVLNERAYSELPRAEPTATDNEVIT